MKIIRALGLLLWVNLMLVGCGVDAEPPSRQDAITPTVSLSIAPGFGTGLPSPPQPSPAAGGPRPDPTGTDTDVNQALLTDSVSAASSAIDVGDVAGWTRYVSLNDIRDLAYAPDGTLWATTSAGLVHWNLGTGTYTRYLLYANTLAVAPDGTIWLVMEQGLCHFDGIHCTELASAGDLPLDGVRSMVVASDGGVWVGAKDFVGRLDNRGWATYPSTVPIEDLAVSTNGDVWAATPAGLARYIPGRGGWLLYTQENGLQDANVRTVATGPNGEVWASLMWGGVSRFDGEHWHPVEGITGGLVSAIALAPDGTPWVATMGSLHYPGGNLAYQDGDRWVNTTAGHGLSSIRIVAVGRQGEIAAASSLGLGTYRDDTWQMWKDGPTTDRATSIAALPDGSVWFGFGDQSPSSPGGGVSRFDGRNWRYYLGDDEVNALAVAPDGALWAAVGCNLMRFDGIQWETASPCSEDLPPGSILDLAFTPNGSAWVANGYGLARYEAGIWTVFDKMAISLYGASDGAIWINGWEGNVKSNYVARFDGQRWSVYPTGGSFLGDFWLGAVTGDGWLWGIDPGLGLVSFSGTDWADGASWQVYPLPDALDSGNARFLGVGPDDTLWIQDSGSLARFERALAAHTSDSGTSEAWRLYPLDSLNHQPAGPIAFDAEGGIWLGSTRFQVTEKE